MLSLEIAVSVFISVFKGKTAQLEAANTAWLILIVKLIGLWNAWGKVKPSFGCVSEVLEKGLRREDPQPPMSWGWLAPWGPESNKKLSTLSSPSLLPGMDMWAGSSILQFLPHYDGLVLDPNKCCLTLVFVRYWAIAKRKLIESLNSDPETQTQDIWYCFTVSFPCLLKSNVLCQGFWGLTDGWATRKKVPVLPNVCKDNNYVDTIELWCEQEISFNVLQHWGKLVDGGTNLTSFNIA